MQDRIVEKLLGILLSGLLGTGGCLSTGCSIPLKGGGKLLLGYESRTALIIEHVTDKSLLGIESRAELEVDPVIKALIGTVPGEAEPTDEPDAPPVP